MPLTPSQQRRVNYLSVMRACIKVNVTGEAHAARIDGVRTLITPEEVPHYQKHYVQSYKPRRRSDSKSARYQREYRERQKEPAPDHPLTPLVWQVCNALKVKPTSKTGFIARQTLSFLDHRGLLGRSPQPRMPEPSYVEAPKLRELKQPTFGPKPKRNKASPAQRPDPSLKYDANGLLELQQPVLDSSPFA